MNTKKGIRTLRRKSTWVLRSIVVAIVAIASTSVAAPAWADNDPSPFIPDGADFSAIDFLAPIIKNGLSLALAIVFVAALVGIVVEVVRIIFGAIRHNQQKVGNSIRWLIVFVVIFALSGGGLLKILLNAAAGVKGIFGAG